jgi:hypothetical protein
MTLPQITTMTCRVAALALGGCAPTPARNVADAPIVSNKARLTMQDVQGAITRAGTGLGWIMFEWAPGDIKGTFGLRSHVAVVEISHDTATYNVQYVVSANLIYDADKGAVQKNYNGWIPNLDSAIQRELAALMSCLPVHSCLFHAGSTVFRESVRPSSLDGAMRARDTSRTSVRKGNCAGHAARTS